MGRRRLPLNARKLLVSAVGVAAVSYLGCSEGTKMGPTSGNLMLVTDPPAQPGPFLTDGSVVDAATDADAGDDAATDAADASNDADDQ